MPLLDQVDRYLGSTGGQNLATEAGSVSKIIAQAMHQDDTVATALLATLFWHAFINSDDFKRIIHIQFGPGNPLLDPLLQPNVLENLSFGIGGTQQLESLIVRHGQGTWPLQDLVIFVHGVDQRLPPLVLRNVAQYIRFPLQYGWNVYIQLLTNRNKGAGLPPLPTIIRQNGGRAAAEVSSTQPFSLLIAPAPLIEYTAFALSSPIEVIPTIGHHMSAGVFAQRSDGREGITTALHALNDSKSSVVKIEHSHFTVLDQDKSPITDSCFIEVPRLYPLRSVHFRSLRSQSITQSTMRIYPLKGVAPGIGTTGSFERVRWGKVQATIIANDIAIPWATRPPNQVKVYTDPVTVPGDSGVALMDDQTNSIIGFCFWRLVGPFAAGAWIWAESVFLAHNLQ